MKPLSLLLPFLLMSTALADSCIAKSPPHRVALVELYTSEGCSSCPPADKWLAQFAMTMPRDKAIPLALHVPYWDYLGWKDRFASPTYETRQRQLAQVNATTVYTPQFFIAGSSVDLTPKDVAQAVEDQNILPSIVDISMNYNSSGATTVSWRHDQEEGKVALVLVVTAAAAQSQVSAGENSNVLLKHTEVAQWWQPLNNKGQKGMVSVTIPKLPKESDDAQGHVLVLALNQPFGKVYQVASVRRDCQVDK